jgi:hypothetical protein
LANGDDRRVQLLTHMYICDWLIVWESGKSGDAFIWNTHTRHMYDIDPYTYYTPHAHAQITRVLTIAHHWAASLRRD